jgi:hypothetical protein
MVGPTVGGALSGADVGSVGAGDASAATAGMMVAKAKTVARQLDERVTRRRGL